MFAWMNNGSRWYALFVKTGKEECVKERINYKFSDKDNYKSFIPKRLIKERKAGVWRYVSRNLFPGYVFFGGMIGSTEYNTLKEIPDLYMVLKDKSTLYEIKEHEIERLLKFTNGGDTIGLSTGYVQGEKIIITDGPLVGFEALIESVDKRKSRARVRMDFMGHPRIVDLDLSLVSREAMN